MSSDGNLIKVSRFLTVFEVAGELGVSAKHVRRAIAREELPIYRFGRAVRIARTDLERYLDRHRQ